MILKIDITDFHFSRNYYWQLEGAWVRSFLHLSSWIVSVLIWYLHKKIFKVTYCREQTACKYFLNSTVCQYRYVLSTANKICFDCVAVYEEMFPIILSACTFMVAC